MYTTVLKIGLPYLQRFLASQAAEYLQKRREQRLNAPEDELPSVECSPCPPSSQMETAITAEVEPSSSSTMWFAMSGILLGGAFSVMLYVILRDTNRRLQV